MQKQVSLPNTIVVSGNQHLFDNIFHEFAKTNYGKILRSNIRFSYFKPTSMSNNNWEKTLGKDVSNLYHLSVSLEITRDFLSQSLVPKRSWSKKLSKEATFSKEDQTVLLFTSVIHDWAEAIIGDIDLTKKKESDEDQEMIVLRDMIHKLLGDGKSKREVDNLADKVVSILTDKNSKLGKAFNAIEKIGYLKTGMKALRLSHKTDGELKTKLKNLSTRVVTVHLPKLTEYAEVYPSIYSYLMYHRKGISDRVSSLDKKEDAYTKWQIFLLNNH